MAQCNLLKKNNGDFIKVNNWFKTCSIRVSSYSSSSLGFPLITKEELGNYSNYETIFFKVKNEYYQESFLLSKGKSYYIIIPLKKDYIEELNKGNNPAHFQFQIIWDKQTKEIRTVDWTGLTEDGISASKEVTFEIIGVSNKIF